MIKLPKGEASARCLYIKYKSRSKKRGILFSLSFEEFLEITKRKCYLCGRPPEQKYLGGARANGHYVYNGVDKVENDKGYVSDNVLPCCKKCNSMKGTYSLVEFKKLISKILKHHTK